MWGIGKVIRQSVHWGCGGGDILLCWSKDFVRVEMEDTICENDDYVCSCSMD